LGTSQVRAVDGARETARALARGEEVDAALGLGRRVAPAGADFRVVTEAGVVRVVVTAVVRGPGDVLPGFDVRAEAVAAQESGR